MKRTKITVSPSRAEGEGQPGQPDTKAKKKHLLK